MSKVSSILGEHTMPHIGKRKLGVQILSSAHIDVELPYQRRSIYIGISKKEGASST